tara:strand:- start:106 stop:693 length:588 start_codon:yes stop_codon:yes gene_type:complete
MDYKKGIVFAQLKANTSKIETSLPKKNFLLFDSSDKVTRYFDLNGDDFKKLFYKNDKFQLPLMEDSLEILGDFSCLDEWCNGTTIGELIKEPYYFDFINEILLSWQKDLGINICDWDQINLKRIITELNKINKWTQHKDYKIRNSVSYTQLIDKLKTPKLMKGSIFQLTISLVNCNPKISQINVILHFRIDKDES